MFSDPLVTETLWSVITKDAAGDMSWVASERAQNHSLYRHQDADLNDHTLFIGHNYGRRARFTIRHGVSGFTPSNLVPDQNTTFTQSVYVVMDVPLSGPIQATTAQVNIFRRQMRCIGGFLIAAGVAGTNPIANRVLLGET
jgi:hypothetical protein